MEFSWKLVAFEILNFGVLVFLLSRFLFEPIRKVLAERREKIEQRNAEVGEREARAEAAHEQYRKKLDEVHVEAEGIRRGARREADAQAEEIVANARRDMARVRERGEDEVAAARRRALEELRDEVRRLAVEAAARVIRGMNDQGVATAFARQGAHELLSAGEPPDGTKVRVAMSTEADADEVREALTEVLGEKCELELSVDESLVGGVRLMLREVEVEASAGASLRSWLESLHAPAAEAADTVAGPPSEPGSEAAEEPAAASAANADGELER